MEKIGFNLKRKFLMICLLLGVIIVTSAHQSRPFWMKSSYFEFYKWYKEEVSAAQKAAKDKTIKNTEIEAINFFDDRNLDSMMQKYEDKITDIGYSECDIDGDKKADTVAVIYQSEIIDPELDPDPRYDITEGNEWWDTYYILFYINGRTPFFETFGASYNNFELSFEDIVPREPRFLVLRAGFGHGTAVGSYWIYIQKYTSNSFKTIFKKCVFGFLTAGVATFEEDFHFEDIDNDGTKEIIFDLKINNPYKESIDESLGPKREIYKYYAETSSFILINQSVQSSEQVR